MAICDLCHISVFKFGCHYDSDLGLSAYKLCVLLLSLRRPVEELEKGYIIAVSAKDIGGRVRIIES